MVQLSANVACTPSGLPRTRYVVEQLQCLGILQTCEVLKVGMPTRVTYKELKEVSHKLEPDCAGVAARLLLSAFSVGERP